MAAPRRILVVDDDEGYGAVVCRMFEKQGFASLLAKSATEGLERLKDSKPDLVLLDIHMKGLNGITLHRTIRADPGTRRTPVILITGESILDSVLEAAAAGLGAEPVFLKSEGLEVLLRRVKRSLASPQSPPSGRFLCRGAVTLDLERREVIVQGHRPRQLGARRFDVLRALMLHPGALTKQELFQRAWRPHEKLGNVGVTIFCLRQDLKDLRCLRIETEGESYELAIDEESA